jgi:hypothetical protein
MTEPEAVDRLASYLAESNYYDDDAGCVKVRSAEYRNRGYTIEVYGAGCSGRRDGLLDRWRVDTQTGKVFRQASDGRYLRP